MRRRDERSTRLIALQQRVVATTDDRAKPVRSQKSGRPFRRQTRDGAHRRRKGLQLGSVQHNIESKSVIHSGSLIMASNRDKIRV